MTMERQNATDRFIELHGLLLGAEVTEQKAHATPLNDGFSKGVDLILETGKQRGKVMLMGNGGSAAIASHMHNDLCKAVDVRSMVFHEQPLMTALANDDGYGCVFERPVEMWAERGDLLIAVSSSGGSENILRGARAAAEKGCSLITLSGFRPDNPLRRMGTLNFYVRAESYGLVEVAHAAIAHILTDMAMERTRL
jgi:D-sedoheptulose 7-phosphate isomerase